MIKAVKFVGIPVRNQDRVGRPVILEQRAAVVAHACALASGQHKDDVGRCSEDAITAFKRRRTMLDEMKRSPEAARTAR